MDPWTMRQMVREILRLIPFLIVFVGGGVYTILATRIAAKLAKRRLQESFLDHVEEAARRELEERARSIRTLEDQIQEEKGINRELARRAKGAIVMSGKVSELLSTADTTPTYRRGSGSRRP